MDWIERKKALSEIMRKYRYVLLILLAGIFLMALPKQEQSIPEIPQAEPAKSPDLQEALADILSNLQGAGNVQVLLTQSKGEQTIYQTDGVISEQEERRETVLIANTQREETGLIRQVVPPVYQGAIVLCQGAADAAVRLSIVEAVMSVTGLTSDHITVLKMK